VRKLKSHRQKSRADDSDPVRVPQVLALSRRIRDRFVDDVPAFDLALEVPDDGRDVLVETLDELILRQCVAVIPREKPRRRLLMPREIVPDELDAVGLAEINEYSIAGHVHFGGRQPCHGGIFTRWALVRVCWR
jgi:hypothetical protein